jgi:cyclohexanone monooxygenase
MIADRTSRNVPAPFDAVVIGAGFSGLYMLHRLREAGLSARVYETAADVGGTWYWNRYPGARCDVESMQYSYSFDEALQQEWEWTERFATQPEILRYLNHVADRFDLRRDIVFGTSIVAARFDDETNVWEVEPAHGKRVAARFLISAVGCLSAARVPELPGLNEFTGSIYHTASWPHQGVDFGGLRVAVIGTGSSGIQAIPEIAKQAAQLTVFQRTPSFSLPARNAPLSQEQVLFWKSRYSELRKHARENTRSGTIYDFPVKSALEADEAERRSEYEARWKKGGANFMYAFNDLITVERSNATAADFVREQIRKTVRDAKLAEALCPYEYPIFTKRICVDTNYFETYNRDNVSLVDLRAFPLKEITPTGVCTADGEREFDVIVFATGFDAITGALIAIDIRGLGGQSLKDKWAHGPRAYLGLASAGFPNLFMLTGPGSPSVLSNMVVSIEQHVEWVTKCIMHMKESGVVRIDVNPTAEDAWVAHVNEVAQQTLFMKAASWYMGANIPGKPRVFMPYLGVANYRQKCDEVVRNGYAGFEFSRVGGDVRADASPVKSRAVSGHGA